MIDPTGAIAVHNRLIHLQCFSTSCPAPALDPGKPHTAASVFAGDLERCCWLLKITALLPTLHTCLSIRTFIPNSWESRELSNGCQHPWFVLHNKCLLSSATLMSVTGFLYSKWVGPVWGFYSSASHHFGVLFGNTRNEPAWSQVPRTQSGSFLLMAGLRHSRPHGCFPGCVYETLEFREGQDLNKNCDIGFGVPSNLASESKAHSCSYNEISHAQRSGFKWL